MRKFCPDNLCPMREIRRFFTKGFNSILIVIRKPMLLTPGNPRTRKIFFLVLLCLGAFHVQNCWVRLFQFSGVHSITPPMFPQLLYSLRCSIHCLLNSTEAALLHVINILVCMNRSWRGFLELLLRFLPHHKVSVLRLHYLWSQVQSMRISNTSSQVAR